MVTNDWCINNDQNDSFFIFNHLWHFYNFMAKQTDKEKICQKQKPYQLSDWQTNEPHHEKTNNVVSKQFRDKPCCTNTEDS